MVTNPQEGPALKKKYPWFIGLATCLQPPKFTLHFVSASQGHGEQSHHRVLFLEVVALNI